MFVEGFTTALGAIAAIAVVTVGGCLIIGIPTYLYLRKHIKTAKEMYEVFKKAQENDISFMQTGVKQ